MHLDIPTLSISIGLVYLSNLVFSLLLYFSKRMFPGAWLWLLGQVLLTIGCMGSVLRNVWPDYVVVCISNTAMISSVICLLHSTFKFRGIKNFPVWTYVAAPIIFVAWVLMEHQSINLRNIVFSVLLGPPTMLIGYLLIRNSDAEYRTANLLTGIPFIGIGIVHLIRLPENLFGPVIYRYPDQGPVNSVILLLSIAAAFFTLFGYYMMASVRAEVEIKHKRDEIAAQNEELKRLSSTKDTLYSVVAHDLRGPIGSAARYVSKYLLPSEVPLDQKRQALETLASTLNTTNSLLENLLSWASSQSGELQMQSGPVSVKHLIADAMAVVSRDAFSKGLIVETPETEAILHADKQTAGMVVRNVLSNAVKFTKAGGRVNIAVVENESSIEIVVSDTGVGMNPVQIERLFNVSNKIVTVGTAGERGSGLGLLLCNEFMRRNGGGIRASSELGKGSTFVLCFPKPQPDPVIAAGVAK